MTVFWRLILAHMFAEFVLFRNATFNLKQKLGPIGYLIHGAVYFVCALLLTFNYAGITWIDFGFASLNGWQALALLGVFHVFCDIVNRSDTAVGECYNTIFFLLWQTIGVLFIFTIFPIIPAEEILHYGSGPDEFLVVLAGAVFVTYFLMMLLYFIKKDLKLEEYPIVDERYATMLFRLILYLTLLTPSLWGYILGAAWLVFIWATKGVRVFDMCNIRITVGVPLTVITAVLTRMLIY
jgi:hypothetical protein